MPVELHLVGIAVLLVGPLALAALLVGSTPHVLNGQGTEVRCGETDRLTTRSRLEPQLVVGLKSVHAASLISIRLLFRILPTQVCARQCALLWYR